MQFVALFALAAVVGWAARHVVGDVIRTAAEEVGMKPGKWFDWDELTRTATGKPNELTDEGRQRLKLLVDNVLDPLREAIGRPIRVTSAWRSPDVNAAIADHAEKSQHMLGEAADILGEGHTSRQVAQVVIDRGIPFDQMIFYDKERGGHLHISFTQGRGRANRREVRHGPAGSVHEPLATITPSTQAGAPLA